MLFLFIPGLKKSSSCFITWWTKAHYSSKKRQLPRLISLYTQQPYAASHTDVQLTASTNKVILLWLPPPFLAHRHFSPPQGGTTGTDGECWGQLAAGEAQAEWSSVRVTSWRCSQPIHNSERPVIRGRKALETILRDQREKTEPWWSAPPSPGDSLKCCVCSGYLQRVVIYA